MCPSLLPRWYLASFQSRTSRSLCGPLGRRWVGNKEDDVMWGRCDVGKTNRTCHAILRILGIQTSQCNPHGRSQGGLMTTPHLRILADSRGFKLAPINHCNSLRIFLRRVAKLTTIRDGFPQVSRLRRVLSECSGVYPIQKPAAECHQFRGVWYLSLFSFRHAP